MKSLIACALLAVTGCASHDAVGPVRYANSPVVWKVNDRAAVAKPPEENEFLRPLYHFDSYYLRAQRGMELQRDRRSLGINAFDEVPDSTWFTNRIGMREVLPAEIRRGPGTGESPDQHFPWKIKSAKIGGKTLGFVAEDTRGVKFVLKFDARLAPEVETAADVVTSRLLWAAGYNVAEDHVVYFKLSDIEVDPKATITLRGKKRPLDKAYIRANLGEVAFASDGSIRGLASVFIAGKTIGGYPRLGVRTDDPNDKIPHELRRDVRGQKSLFAWVAHNDIKQDNTLDAYQPDPKDPSSSYVMHYLIDFGSALGAQALILRRPQLDFQYEVDPKEWGHSLITLGLHKQPWEGRIDPHLRGIGLFSADDYDPETWKPATFGQIALLYADRIDKFWGAKIAMKFTRPQLQAAVDAGRYSDKRAAEYLVDTLIARQRITAKTYFSQVNPIDDITVDGNQLCFTDLSLLYGLETSPTIFTLQAYDEKGRELGYRRNVGTHLGAKGLACVTDLKLALDGSRYTIVKVNNSRGMPGTQLHVAIDPATQKPRLIGVYRL